METWVAIIAALGGLSGIGTALWWLINLRSKRKVESAKARQEDTKADVDVIKLLHAEIEYFHAQLDAERAQNLEKTQLIRKLNDQLLAKTQEHGDLQKRYEMEKCQRLTCHNRIPPNAYTFVGIVNNDNNDMEEDGNDKQELQLERVREIRDGEEDEHPECSEQL